MLTGHEVRRLAQEGESLRVEFKRDFDTDSVRRAVVAFANDYCEVNGGVIVLGVDPRTGGIVAVEGDLDILQQRIAGVCRDGSVIPYLAPAVYPVAISGVTVIVIEVPRSPRRPHRAANIAYIRVGSTTRQATPDEEFELHRRSGATPYDLTPVHEASIADLDLTIFETNYLPRRLSTDAMTVTALRVEDWLQRFRFLVVSDRPTPTVAALLAFGRDPQRFIPGAVVDFKQFMGQDRAAGIGSRKRLVGTIPSMIPAAIGLIENISRE